MRRYIFLVLMFLGSFLLSGCGGGSDNISNTPETPDTTTAGNPAIDIKPYAMKISGDSFTLRVSFVKKLDSSYKVELSDFDLSTQGCALAQEPIYKPSKLTLSGGVGSVGIVDISGVFNKDCLRTIYTFSATQKTTKDGKVDTRMFSITYDNENPDIDIVPSTGFYNATTPLEVEKANTQYEIKVQMIENGYVASDKLVLMKPFDSTFGTVSEYSATTGADGYVTFNYTSPIILPENGIFSNIELTHNDNGIEIKQNIILKFNVPLVDTAGMILTAAPDTVNVVAAGDSSAITLYLSNTDGPVADTSIKANWFNPNSGTLNVLSGITNGNGQVVFNYTAPAILPTDDLTLTFKVENGTLEVLEDVTVTFGELAVPPVDTEGMKLQAIPSDFNITAIEESKAISLYLSKGANAVADVNIKANFFDPSSGTLSTYNAITNANGQAVFNYTVPEVLPASALTITFDVENASVSLAEDVTVNFVDVVAVPPVDTTGMTLTAAPDTVNVALAGDSAAVTLYLSNTDGPVANTNIKANWFNPNSGTLNTYSVTTSANGQVVFNYTAPAALPADDLTLTFEVENGTPGISEDVTVTFGESGVPPVDTTGMTLQAIPSDFNITTVGENKTISLYLSKGTNAVAGINVKANFFDPSAGTLSTYSGITNENGQAVFNYIAPEVLPASALTITFDVDNASASLAQDVTVSFVDEAVVPPVDTSNYNLTAVPNEVNITTAGESKAVSLFVEDTATSSPVADTAVKANFFNPANGTLSTYNAVTNENGQAVFNYTAPENLPSSGFDITFLFENATDEKSTAVAVNFVSEQPVDTTGMTLQAVPSNFNITTAGESKAISLYLSKGANAVVGINVKANFFDPSSGTLDTYSGVTNDNGQALFNYTAPEVLPLSALIITFDVDNASSSLAQDVTVNFVQIERYKFTNVSDIEINHGSQKKDIKAQLTFDGIPIAGKTVQMENFNEENGTILNSFSVTTDSVGYATFFYMAPETLDEVNGTTLSLKIRFDEDATHINVDANVTFNETIDNTDGNITLPIVVIPQSQREIILDSNSKIVEILISVYKDIAPYAEGSVKVQLPKKVLNGVDVGKFDSYEVAVNENGIATFNYTGPSNLQALIDEDDNESIFQFYHVENNVDKKNMKVIYNPSDPHVTRNYEVDIITTGEFSMGIPDKEKTFNVFLKARDGTGEEVPLSDENITSIVVSTKNSTIAQILDTSTDTLEDNLTLIAMNNSPFILKSKELSGLVPIEVVIGFKDVNGDDKNESTIVNVRVYSGPPSAISISYVSTGQDVDRAKYIEKLAISATDEYGNRVNTRPNISLGAIVGYTVDGSESNGHETNETRRLFYGRTDIELDLADGKITAPNDANKARFKDTILSDVFQYANTEGNNTDKLVIFGERKNYEAMGKWDFKKTDVENILALSDNYYGVSRSGLYYAVGHNYYQDQCREDGREWIGSTDSETYQLDEEGTVIIDYKYDYHLTGKDASIWVNLDGIQPDTGAKTRIGEVVKSPLRGYGLVQAPSGGYSLAPDAAGYGTFQIWHENAPERYRNGHFGYVEKGGSTCYAEVVASSNWFDARTCDNGNPSSSDGGSYVTFYLEDPAGKGCTFNIENIAVSNEF